MIPRIYKVTLTNGTTQQEYTISAMGEREAIILAQAEAINSARGYELISVNQVQDNKKECLFWGCWT